MSFSERHGIIPKKKVQIKSIDKDLRTKLWNYLYTVFITTYGKDILRIIWTDFYKRPLDDFYEEYHDNIYNEIKHNFFKMEWNREYDFIELLFNELKGKPNYLRVSHGFLI